MIKNIFKKIILIIITTEPIFRYLFNRRVKNNALVLMYHEMANDSDEIDSWTVIKKTNFIEQINLLKKYYDIVSVSEAVSLLKDGNKYNKPVAIITFDDGDMGNYTVLRNVIESLEVPVTIFVSTKHITDQKNYWFDRIINEVQTNKIFEIDLTNEGLDVYAINKHKGKKNWIEIERLLADLKTLSPNNREEVVNRIIDLKKIQISKHIYKIEPLTIDALKEISRSEYFTIGSHSHCHNILTQLNEDEIAYSISKSKRLLSEWLNKEIEYFAYPNGDYNTDVMRILKKEGFTLAMTTGGKQWKISNSLFEIPRIGIGRYDTIREFKLKILRGL